MQLGPVRQIRSKTASYEDAVRLFRAAKYDEVLGALFSNTTIPATLLRARALFRTGASSAAVDLISRIELSNASDSDAAEGYTQLAFGLISTGEFNSAAKALTDARVRALSSGSSALEGDVDYATAMYFLALGQFDDARSAALKLVTETEIDGGWTAGVEGVLSRAEVRARAFDFLGSLAGRELDFSANAAFCRMAVLELRELREPDQFIKAKLLLNLIRIAVEVDIPGVFEFVREEVESTAFSAHTREFEFEIRRALGACSSSRGDHVGALREYRRSASVAPNLASRIKVAIDRSVLAEEINEITFADEELDHALSLMKQVDWSVVSDGAIFALLAVASKLAKCDPSQARRILDSFRSCKHRVHFTSTAIGSDSYVGWELQVEASIARAEGLLDRARVLYIAAFDAYTRGRLESRAASVALELFDLTGESSYLESASAYAEKVPHSRIARRMKSFSLPQYAVN